MKNYTSIILFLLLCIFCQGSYAQDEKKTDPDQKVTPLFSGETAVPVKLDFSIKEIKKQTNDSTYVETIMGYAASDGTWSDINTKLRVRGYFRLSRCTFPPIKLKFKKEDRKNTLFEGNKELKLVLQCNTKKGAEDYIIKEYMAYKLYELVSDYHYKTRLADVSLSDTKDAKGKNYEINGFFIEDIKKVAKRFDGEVMKRSIHPMAQDPMESVHNSFFQYMIGNTDFSTYAQHNEKLIYVNKNIIPLPYDFDMSGLVNASYAAVSEKIEESSNISSVRDRLYRGFKRDAEIIAQVRQEFLDNQNKMMEVIDGLEPLFMDPKNFSEARKYIVEFFEVMSDDKLFHKEITRNLRTN